MRTDVDKTHIRVVAHAALGALDRLVDGCCGTFGGIAAAGASVFVVDRADAGLTNRLTVIVVLVASGGGLSEFRTVFVKSVLGLLRSGCGGNLYKAVLAENFGRLLCGGRGLLVEAVVETRNIIAHGRVSAGALIAEGIALAVGSVAVRTVLLRALVSRTCAVGKSGGALCDRGGGVDGCLRNGGTLGRGGSCFDRLFCGCGRFFGRFCGLRRRFLDRSGLFVLLFCLFRFRFFFLFRLRRFCVLFFALRLFFGDGFFLCRRKGEIIGDIRKLEFLGIMR